MLVELTDEYITRPGRLVTGELSGECSYFAELCALTTLGEVIDQEEAFSRKGAKAPSSAKIKSGHPKTIYASFVDLARGRDNLRRHSKR
jgi:hypothetical protein